MFSAQKLAQVMKSRKLTAYALAKKADVSHQWIQALLRGDIRLPRRPYMDKLTEALEVAESDLMDYPEREESSDSHLDATDSRLDGADVNLLAIRDLDPEEYELIVAQLAVRREKLERERKEMRRAQRRARKPPEEPGKGNSEEGPPQR